MLREAYEKGVVPSKLVDLDQDDFLRTDYNGLKEIVEKYRGVLH